MEFKRFENLEKSIMLKNTKSTYIAIEKNRDILIGIKDAYREISLTLRKLNSTSSLENKTNPQYRVNVQILKRSKKKDCDISDYLSGLVVFNNSNLIEEICNIESLTYEIDDFVQKDLAIKLVVDIEYLFNKINDKMDIFANIFDEHKELKEILPVAFSVFGFEEMNKMMDQMTSREIEKNDVINLILLNCAY